jgi:hypothetical protein
MSVNNTEFCEQDIQSSKSHPKFFCDLKKTNTKEQKPCLSSPSFEAYLQDWVDFPKL